MGYKASILRSTASLTGICFRFCGFFSSLPAACVRNTTRGAVRAAMTRKMRTEPRESLHDFIEKKREMFMVEIAIQSKRNESQHLRTMLVNRRKEIESVALCVALTHARVACICACATARCAVLRLEGRRERWKAYTGAFAIR